MARTWFSLVFAFVATLPLHAQVLKRLPYVSYNVNEGLLQSQVTDITEDGNGFIWVSYANGIQRFDGRNFLPVNGTTESYADADRSVKFFRLRNGNIWISHREGITYYDRFTHRFKLIVDGTKKSADKSIWCISEDSTGIWCYLQGKGLYQIDKENYLFRDSLTLPQLNTKPIVASEILMLKDYAVFQAGGALWTVNKSTRQLNLIKASSSQYAFFDIELYKGDSILVATLKGIYKVDCRSGNSLLVCGYKSDPASVNPLHPVQLKMLTGNVCLVSEANRLFELNISSNQYQAEIVNQQNKALIEIGYITSIVPDHHKNIWIVTENDGIRKINYRFAGFRYFGTEERQRNFSKSIYVDKQDNRVLCGAFGWGMTIFDTTGRELKVIDRFPGDKQKPTVCGFRKIGRHQYLILLMGTWDSYLLNTQTFALTPVKADIAHIQKSDLALRLPDYHLSIYPLNDSVSLVQSGYFAYRLKWRAPATIVYEPVNRSSEPSISSYVDKKQRFWIGSYGKYLVSNTNDHSAFSSFEIPDKKLVRAFFDGGEGTMWLGTAKGLYQLNEHNEILKVWTRMDGMVDDDIFAIRGDKMGNIWFSHNKGLSCLKKNKSFLHFSRMDGLQENEFNTNSSFETPDGELYFGGVNGVSGFYPETVTAFSEQPQIVLTGLIIKDQPYTSDTATWNLSRIELPYMSNVLSFNFTALGNRPADQYNYQYQLIGQDEQWVNGGSNPQVRYVLQPGNYRFRYYAGNSFDSNPSSVNEIIIRINPPFWKTTWFIVSSIVLLTTVVVLTTRTIARRKLKKQVAELLQTKLLNEERLRISREMHDDIGAGLTQITLMSEAAKNLDYDKRPLDEIAGTSRKLVGSINEIIWSLQPGNQSLEQLLAYLREQLHQLLEYSGIQYKIDFPENGKEVLLTNAQRRNLLLVTKEIVHNAVKHSKAQNITVACHSTNSTLEFDITDDGVGFNPSKKSNGNGLHNIQRRIDELGGSISIRSYGDSGSHFFYSVPISN